MLCPICLGRGWATEEEIKEYPLRCEECHGKGKVSIDWHSYKCGVCDGTGKKELTNQLYIQNCTIEELAEVISNIARSCYECGKNPMKNFCYFGHCLLADMGAEVWLKEKKE